MRQIVAPLQRGFIILIQMVELFFATCAVKFFEKLTAAKAGFKFVACY